MTPTHAAEVKVWGSTSRRRPSPLLVWLAALALVASPTAALATTCADVCGAGTGDCHVTSPVTVTPGSVLDCSGRDLFVDGSSGRIEVTNGTVTVIANDLTIAADRRIEAFRTSAGTPYGIAVQLTGNLLVHGYLRAKHASGGGTIDVWAEGDVTVSSSGTIGIIANGTAGGGPGGKLTISSTGNVLIEDTVEVQNDSGTGAANGGEVLVEALGDVTIDAPVRVRGRNAEGGQIRVVAAGTVTVSNVLEAEGAGPDGDGGLIDLSGARVETWNTLSAQGGAGSAGGYSEGGTVRMQSGAGGIAVEAAIDATGGEEGAGFLDEGAIVLLSAGDVSIGYNVLLSTKSDRNHGDGGDVVIDALGAITFGGHSRIDARGHMNEFGGGAGGIVRLGACTITVPDTTWINVTGEDGGDVLLTARGAIAAAGSFTATGTDSDGVISLRHRVHGTCSNDPLVGCTTHAACGGGTCSAPIAEGGTFAPAATFELDPSLMPCSEVP